MEIRKAKREDAKGISYVHIQSWKETYKGIISQGYLDSLKIEDREPLWEKSLSETAGESSVFVAVNPEGDIVGFASFGKERTGNFKADGELYAIYLLKKYQKDKVGLRLLQRGVDELFEKKYRSMLVWVLAENRSRQFYESLHPEKAAEEVVSIASQDFVELAYQWDDLKSLKQLVINKL